ncbi:MAG TPA: DUF1775 domain-containing protein [Gaiellaceae bacterium]|nr:DUF1775 domain-containing protein [Gaiellaceae bacterium]
MSTRTRIGALVAVAATALAAAAVASAHAKLSPPVVLAKAGQVFTLAVPTEKDGAVTTQVELTPPEGFSIDSFVPSPGWKRTVQQEGSGEDAEIERVTWSGGRVPTGEDAVFQFLGRADESKTYAFSVRQTYSDGSVVEWDGPESSDTPSPTFEAVASLGGGGSSTLSLVAVALAGLALVVAVGGLVVRGGGAREVA